MPKAIIWQHAEMALLKPFLLYRADLSVYPYQIRMLTTTRLFYRRYRILNLLTASVRDNAMGLA